MSTWLAIAVGGSFGAITRFWVANGIYGFLGRDFPHGTLFINVSGSFLMGFLTELLLQRFPSAAEYRAGVLIGFLGAYTTFSTFAIETLYLIEEGSLWKAGLNMLLSVVLCIVAVWLGLVLGRRLFSGGDFPWLGHGSVYARLAGIFGAGILAGMLAELSFQHGELAVALRAGALTVLLGLLTIMATLTILPHLAEAEAGSEVLGWFTASALASALMVGLGMSIGKWV